MQRCACACVCRQVPYVHGYPAAAFSDYVPVLKSYYTEQKNILFFKSKEVYEQLESDVNEHIKLLKKEQNISHLNEVLEKLKARVENVQTRIKEAQKNFSQEVNEWSKKKIAEQFGTQYIILMRFVWVIQKIAEKIESATSVLNTVQSIYFEAQEFKTNWKIASYWGDNMKYQFDSVAQLCLGNMLIADDRPLYT